MEQLCRILNKRTCSAGSNCLLTVLIFLTFWAHFSLSFSQSSGSNPFTLVIDAGHGGKDPGAVGKKSYEKNIALAIAIKLGSYIESRMPDVKVIYTRKTDVFIDLDVRAGIANNANADLFLSIHVDGIGTPNAYGTSTYVMGITKNKTNLALAKKENKVIELEKDYTEKYQGFDPNNPTDEIMYSAVQGAYIKQSLKMASRVQDQFRTRAKRRDRGVHPAPFLVLWKTTMPSVLIENGYITNPREEDFLNTVYGQDIMASAIYRAFIEFKTDTEARTASNYTYVSDETGNNDDTSIIAPMSKPELEFRVQILASRNRIPANSKVFKGYRTFEETRDGIYYKYTSAPKLSYEESSLIRKQLLKSFPGAFIVAFKNGKKIPLQEAIEEEKKIH